MDKFGATIGNNMFKSKNGPAIGNIFTMYQSYLRLRGIQEFDNEGEKKVGM